MSKFLEELLSSSEGSNEPRKFVFFNDEDVEGYCSQKDLLASLRKQKRAKPYRINHLKTMFDNMALGRGLMGEPSLAKENGEDVIWCKFSYGKTRQNLQILNECGMYDFIKDYAVGRVQNVPTFDELINSMNVE